jgi:hypothetical protein
MFCRSSTLVLPSMRTLRHLRTLAGRVCVHVCV